MELVKAKSWNLDAIRAVAVGRGSGETRDVAILRRIEGLTFPSADAFSEACAELDRAVLTVSRLRGGQAASSLELCALLGAALQFHRTHQVLSCPVCGAGTLDDSWATRTEASVAALRISAREAEDANRALKRANEKAIALVQPAPKAIVDAVAGIAGLLATWTAFAEIEGLQDGELSKHLEKTHGAVRSALEVTQRSAAALLAEREEAWRSTAALVRSWVGEAQAVKDVDAVLKDIQAAENWLKVTSAEIRAMRFDPIAVEAVSIWQVLRVESNVDLQEVALEGTGPKRHAVLRVGVDGAPADALSVMSQGELHSIALSLFIPRATMPESPFRFLVIDDPVQSMDPARVDGLARVLEHTVKSGRQVIVFTHDDRLPEAVRRLGIEAVFVGVTRGAGSAVMLRLESDPVGRALSDAMALMKTAELPPAVANQVVPGYCRAALEAACFAVIRRRRLGRGERHAEVEELLSDLKLTTLFALALFDDVGRGGDVLPRLNKDFGGPLADAFVAANRGSHLGQQGALAALVRDTESLAGKMEALR